MKYKAILIPILCFALLYSQNAFTANADESADILTALSPYNVLVEAAYSGEKVKLAGLVIQRGIVPGYNKDADSTKFYILISLSRIPDCFLSNYRYTVWQDKYDKDKRAQLRAQSVSATLHRANAKANIGILRCNSLPYPVDGFPFLVSFTGKIDKDAYDSRKSFVLTPPTSIERDNRFIYTGKSANAKEFSIGSPVVLRGNTAYEVDKLSPLITGDPSFTAGVPLFYPDPRSPLKYCLAGLINFERYAPDVRLDNGQLYSATAYYYPVEYIRRAILHALPPSKNLDLPAQYKGMRASGAKVTTAATDNSLQIDDEITAIDGVPFDTKWGISASLYIALNYSGGSRLCSIKYERPGIKGKQAIEKAELQSSNSLWFGADAVPLPSKLKEDHYKNSDSGFFVRSTNGSLQHIAVTDLIQVVQKVKDRTRFDEKFQRCCPRLDMWLWDNFKPGDKPTIIYWSFKPHDGSNLLNNIYPLTEWANYPDTFSLVPKSGVTPTTPTPPSTDFAAAITAAQNAIQDLNAAIAKVTDTPPAGSELGKALQAAKDLKAKMEGYLNTLNSPTATAEQKTKAQAGITTDISKVKDCIEALEKARVAYKPADTTTETTSTPPPPPSYNDEIYKAEAAIGQLGTAISDNKPKDVGYPAEGPLADAKVKAETLVRTLQEIVAILKGEKDGDKESENKRLTDQIAKVSTCISELENAKKAYDQDKAKTAAETSIGKLGAAIAKVTETPPADSELGKALQDAKDLKAKLEGYLSTLNSNDATDAKKTEAQEGIEEEVKEENGISKVSECVNKLANAKAAYDISTELISLKNSANTAIAAAREAGQKANVAAEAQANTDLIAQAEQYRNELYTDYNALNNAISAAKSAANNATDKAEDLEKLIAILTTENYAEKKVSVDSILANLYTLTTNANTACENISRARDALQSALNRKLQSNLKGRAEKAIDAAIKAAEAARKLANGKKHLIDDATDLGLEEVVYKPLEDAIEKAKAAAATAEGKATELEGKLPKDNTTILPSKQKEISEAIKELTEGENSLKAKTEAAEEDLREKLDKLIEKLVEALKAKADATVKSAKVAANKAKISASATELSTLQQEAKQLDVNHEGLEYAISATKNAADQLDNRANALLTLLDQLGPGTYESKKTEILNAITELQTAQGDLDTKTGAITAAATALQVTINDKNQMNSVVDLQNRMAQAIQAVKTQNGKTDAALADADAIIEAARAMKLDTLTVFTELSNARNNADDAKQTSQKKAEDLEEQRDALTKDNFEEKKTGTEKLIAELTSKEDGLNSITAKATAKVREQASKMFELLKQKANDIKNGAEKVRENASDAKEKLLVSLAELRADKNSAQLFGLVSVEPAKANDYKNLLADIETRALKFAPSGLPQLSITVATATTELTAKFEQTVKPALDALSAISKAIEDSQSLLRDGWPNSLSDANATNANAIQTAYMAFESLPSLTETAKKATINPGDTMWFIIAITFIILFVVLAVGAIYLLNKSEKEKKNTEANFESYKKSYEKSLKDTNRVASLEESVNWLKAQLQQNNDKIVGLNDTITKRETEIQELQKKIDELSKNPPGPIDPDTQNEIESLKAEIARLEEEFRRRGTPSPVPIPPVPIPPTAQLTSGQIRLLKAVARFDSGSKQKLTEDCHINIESLHEIDKYINAMFVQQTIAELNKLNNIHGIYGSDRDKAIGHYTAKNAKMIKIPVSLLHKIAKGEGVFSLCKVESKDDSKSVSQAIVVTAPQISAEQIQPTAEPLQNGNLTFAALMLTPAAASARHLLKALHEACAKLEPPQGESAIQMPVGEIANAGLSSSDLSDAVDFINSELPKCSDIITSSNKLITISNDKTVIYVYLSITNILYSTEHESIIKQTNQTNGSNQ